jgi:hypothetical protein
LRKNDDLKAAKTQKYWERRFKWFDTFWH